MNDPLTLDQMRTLIAIVETGSFSAAARRLERVQSAVSQSVHVMEASLGLVLFDRATKTPKLTEDGAAIVVDAREVLAQARKLHARAESLREGVEGELTLAVDALFPMPALIDSLAALRAAFPLLPATLFTEELGGAVETLRSGAARLAIHPLVSGPQPDLSTQLLTTIKLLPVVAAAHPLAQLAGPIERPQLENHIQLVLTGRSNFAVGLRGGIISRQIWRFADLHTRLECVLAGFGWCRMPAHLVDQHIAAGRLKRLVIADEEIAELPLYVVYERGHTLGLASKWLIDDLSRRLRKPAREAFAAE